MCPIDRAAFAKVTGVSLVFVIGLVVLFSLGIVGLSMARGRGAPADGTVAARGGRHAGAVVAGICFVLCAAAVLYGFHLIVPQFH